MSDIDEQDDECLEFQEPEYGHLPEVKEPNKVESGFLQFLKYQKKWVKLLILLFLILATLLATLFLGYYFYWIIIPKVWNWGTNPLSFRVIGSLFAILFLSFIPLIPFGATSETISRMFSLFATDFEENIEKIERQQLYFKDVLDENDVEKLLPLITHSRVELEQYYKIGLTQTEKSYKYAILAMWLGLLIIFVGMLTYIFPNQLLNDEIKKGNLQPLIFSGGIVLEIISVVFLSIYKTSLGRLTYFYDRQVFIHNSLFAFKIAKTMENQDESKLLIVQKILDFGSKNQVTNDSLISANQFEEKKTDKKIN